jgi:hypothetical protein
MRRYPFFLLLLASCGSDQSFVYDLDPIQLARAPITPGGAATGGLLANVTTSAGIQPLLVDSAYPINSLAPAGCAGGGTPGWTYTGNMDLRDASAAAVVRASFDNVGLFDLCPGPTGDAATQPAGVMGGPLLANFSVGFVFPRSAELPATMTLWPAFPGSDDRLGARRLRVPAFQSARWRLRRSRQRRSLADAAQLSHRAGGLRGAARFFHDRAAGNLRPAARSRSRPAGRISRWPSAPAKVRSFSANPPGAHRRAAGMASDAGTAGDLYTPFSTAPIPRALSDRAKARGFQGTTDTHLDGPCTELARARRIEWALANQDQGACFQPCDASGGQALATHPYLELGGAARPRGHQRNQRPHPLAQRGHATQSAGRWHHRRGHLGGNALRLDYTSQPQGRVIATCEDGSTRDQCWTPQLLGDGRTQARLLRTTWAPQSGWAPVCP